MIDLGTDEPGHSLHTLVYKALKSCKLRELLALLRDKTSLVRSAAARELQGRGGRTTFLEACKFLDSKRVNDREIAAFLLGQLGYPDMPFKTESVPLLQIALANDASANVRTAAAAALGHLRAKESLGALIAAAKDEAADVRIAVAFALYMLPRGRRSRACLAELARDEDEDVREWACL